MHEGECEDILFYSSMLSVMYMIFTITWTEYEVQFFLADNMTYVHSEKFVILFIYIFLLIDIYIYYITIKNFFIDFIDLFFYSRKYTKYDKYFVNNVITNLRTIPANSKKCC